MVFHILLGLVGKPPLPINIVYTIEDARQPALPYLPSPSSSSSNPKIPFRKFIYKSILRIIHTHSYKLLSLTILSSVAKYHYQCRYRTIIGVWLLLAYTVYRRQLYLIRKWSNNFASHQYQYYTNLKDDPIYHSQSLINESYQQQVGLYYKPLFVYQPISGYCGYATLNTVLASITVQRYYQQHIQQQGQGQAQDEIVSSDIALSKGILQFYSPNYIAVDVMCDLLDKLKAKGLWSHFGIDGYDDLSGITYPEYMKHIHQLNNPQYRYMACWHRSPLFFCHKDDALRIQSQAMVHWSPLASYLPDRNLMMVLDVNENYSEFMVTPERFFSTIDIRDFVSGKYMGLVRIRVSQ